jgi:hypothetical protein
MKCSVPVARKREKKNIVLSRRDVNRSYCMDWNPVVSASARCWVQPQTGHTLSWRPRHELWLIRCDTGDLLRYKVTLNSTGLYSSQLTSPWSPGLSLISRSLYDLQISPWFTGFILIYRYLPDLQTSPWSPGLAQICKSLPNIQIYPLSTGHTPPNGIYLIYRFLPDLQASPSPAGFSVI